MFPRKARVGRAKAGETHPALSTQYKEPGRRGGAAPGFARGNAPFVVPLPCLASVWTPRRWHPLGAKRPRGWVCGGTRGRSPSQRGLWVSAHRPHTPASGSAEGSSQAGCDQRCSHNFSAGLQGASELPPTPLPIARARPRSTWPRTRGHPQNSKTPNIFWVPHSQRSAAPRPKCTTFLPHSGGTRGLLRARPSHPASVPALPCAPLCALRGPAREARGPGSDRFPPPPRRVPRNPGAAFLPVLACKLPGPGKYSFEALQ